MCFVSPRLKSRMEGIASFSHQSICLPYQPRFNLFSKKIHFLNSATCIYSAYVFQNPFLTESLRYKPSNLN